MTNKQEVIDWLKTNFTPSAPASYIISELEKLDLDTEISDEEIEKGAIDWYEKERPYKPSAIALNTWLNACKWYREQLKIKQ